MSNPLLTTWKKLIIAGLEEDSIAFDWTARATQKARALAGKSAESAAATLIAKSKGIWAGEQGLSAVRLLSKEMGMPLEIRSFVKDGEVISPRQKICEWNGSPDSIVIFERTLINLAAYACGIATQTHELVKQSQSKGLGRPPRITATRKTLPGYRDLAIESTIIGGAYPHRYNLSGGLLLKENHIAAAGGIIPALKQARETAPHLLKIEIEVRNIEELKEAMSGGAEVIMLDNFTPALVREAIALKPHGVVYEVSGGINSSNLDSYLIEGLDVISVGSLTHSVHAVDLSLLMNDVK